MNDTFPHDTIGCAASAITVRGCSGSTVGPSGSHYIIGPLQKASGPREKEKTAMSHFWDTHHSVHDRAIKAFASQDVAIIWILLCVTSAGSAWMETDCVPLARAHSSIGNVPRL